MGAKRGELERIAAALERIAPPTPEPVDWLASPAYVWSGESTRTVLALKTTPLETLRGIDQHKAAICSNFARLASGAVAHDMLLWGARGMGKSALIRAAAVATQDEHPGKLALIQVAPGALANVTNLIAELSVQARAFVLFIDDLGFGAGDTQDNLALRSLLDGGVMARPANVRLAVTSNRRAIVQRNAAEDGALHERDERDNALALADRFGLTRGFHPCDRDTYLEILHAYTDPLGITFDEEEALAWSIARGSRSGRTAYQFACELAGREGFSL
ncbi:MAG: DUF815 domain-containing protein [Marivita sp.]|uniref:DUF815 domain-containing protein n=1 Tax=Marivita sp. TaxID=2003365 RepID=UPI003EF8B1BA